VLFLPHGNGRLKVDANDILYAEAEGNYVNIHFAGNKIILRKTLKELCDELLTGEAFVRIHKSYVINRRHLKKISFSEVTLDNGQSLPLGRAYADAIK